MKWTKEQDEYIITNYSLSATSKSGLVGRASGIPCGYLTVTGMVVKGAHGESIEAKQVFTRLHQLRMVNPVYLNELFVVDESVPSGLKWRAGRCAGEPAGSSSGQYWQVRIGGTQFYSHVLIIIMAELAEWEKLIGVQSEYVGDHLQSTVSGGLNITSNLRVVSQRENSQNSHKHQSGRLVGCTFVNQKNKWKAQIHAAGFKQKHLGYFDTELAAHEAYKAALALLEVGQLQLTPESKPEPITFEYLQGSLAISAESPSGLLWVAGKFKGKPAGYLTSTGDWYVGPKGKLVLAHHIITILTKKEGYEQLLKQINGERKGLIVDHADGDHMNNTPNNLRIISQRLNAQNQKAHRAGSSVGVTYHKRDKVWQVSLTKPGDIQTTHYGSRKTQQEATLLRNAIWYSWVDSGLITWAELLLPDSPIPERT